MSPNNPSNFVSDLVEMAKAFEELPRVKEELADARVSIDAQQATIQRLELKLLDRSNELDVLNQRIRSLEVERDEAQFHALEADDRTARALDFIKATFGNAGTLIQALEPPRVDAAQPVDPTTNVTTIPTNTPEPEAAKPEPDWHAIAATTDAPPPSPAPEVATQPDPTPASMEATSETAPSMTGTDAAIGTSPDPRPYAGKTWTQWYEENPGIASPDRDEWLAGGGTVDNWYA